jgi:hypothetical protein
MRRHFQAVSALAIAVLATCALSQVTAPFTNLTFFQDYTGDGTDANGKPLDGTECNVIVAHRGQLYASITYLPEDRNWTNINPKILVKRSADGAWEVDQALGNQYIRAATMRSVAFTTDQQGKPLAAPEPVLIVGDWKAAKPVDVGIWTRDDASGHWTRTVLCGQPQGGTPDVRMLCDHVDRVTRTHYVFAGVSTGAIYRGAYDPAAPGRVAWEVTPELEGVRGRPLCAAEANGELYVAFALQLGSPLVGTGGLFRRIDGPAPRWEPVTLNAWRDPADPTKPLVDEMRGLTAVPDARGGKHQVLLCGLKEPSCSIERLDPEDGFRVTRELDVRGYFEKLWGAPVGKHLIIAYNDMPPAVDPNTKHRVNLIGLWVAHPEGEGGELGRSSWYLVRHADGTYAHGRVFDAKNPPIGKYGLRATRTICASPFPGDRGQVFYFGGFDEMSGSAPGKNGWIYKAVLP